MALTKVSYSMITGSVINVKDYGAKGDYNEDTSAGTDDTLAIQAAINAVAARVGYNKGSVYLPYGSYKITTALQVPYGVSIFGEGGTASVIFALNCNGLQFITFGYSIGSMFYEDFGISSAGGSNYTAIATHTNASTMDGLYFNRLRIWGFNTAIYFSANWNCTISNCVMENINVGIQLAGGDGETIGIRILNNRIVRAAGGNGTSPPVGVSMANTAKYTESVHIAFNQIYGFATNIQASQVTYLTVLDNDLSGSGSVITFTTPAGGYNISNNYIEVGAGGIGIFGAGQNSEVAYQRCVIASNYFIGSTETSAIGIQMSIDSNNYQWNTVIRDNTFSGFNTNDIALHNPGKMLIDNNRCMSTAPTNSVYMGTVYGEPVTFTNNYLEKGLAIANLPDYAAGKLIMVNNVENNTFKSNKSVASPSTGTGRVTDIVYNNAPATGGYAGWVCTVAGSPGTWKPFGLIA